MLHPAKSDLAVLDSSWTGRVADRTTGVISWFVSNPDKMLGAALTTVAVAAGMVGVVYVARWAMINKVFGKPPNETTRSSMGVSSTPRGWTLLTVSLTVGLLRANLSSQIKPPGGLPSE